MSNVANTSLSIQSMLHEAYSDGVGSYNHPKKKKFNKIKSSVGKDKEKSCPCKKIEKCGCKVK